MDRIFQLAGGKVWCGLLRIGDYTGKLFKEEYELTRQWSDKRKRDFSTGRVLSRSVLAKMGIHACAIMPGSNGAPIWPTGISGSISHSGDVCFAAVSCLPNAIGVDVQQITQLAPGLAAMICTEHERRASHHLPGIDSNAAANIIFSAKESMYKCLPSSVAHHIDFHDAVITLGNRSFTAIIDRLDMELGGVFMLHDGYVFTGVMSSARHM